MKKFIFGLMATMMLTTTVFAQGTPPKDDLPLIQFEFGRKSRDCGGFGICIFKINIAPELGMQILTAVILKPGGNLKIMMKPEDYRANSAKFQNGYLVIDEDFVIDRETTRKLGAADDYTIRKGKYQVVFDKSTNTYNCTF